METGLYYLQTRYYDPEFGRFISPDSTKYLDPTTINGLNLYSYCLNNPVMYADPKGHSVILALLLGAVVGGFISGGINVISQLASNDWDFEKVNWGRVVHVAITGAALGLSTALGVAFLGPLIAGTATANGLATFGAFMASTGVAFGAGALGYVVEEHMNGRTPSLKTAMKHGTTVMFESMFNFAAGGMSGSFGKIGTKGKFLVSVEWYQKIALGWTYSWPMKFALDTFRFMED